MKVNIPIGNQPPISESKGGSHGSGSPDGEMRNKLKSVGAVVVCLLAWMRLVLFRDQGLVCF